MGVNKDILFVRFWFILFIVIEGQYLETWDITSNPSSQESCSSGPMFISKYIILLFPCPNSSFILKFLLEGPVYYFVLQLEILFYLKWKNTITFVLCYPDCRRCARCCIWWSVRCSFKAYGKKKISSESYNIEPSNLISSLKFPAFSDCFSVWEIWCHYVLCGQGYKSNIRIYYNIWRTKAFQSNW